MADATCVRCAATFTPRKMGKPQRYCTKQCYTNAANDRARARSMAKPRKGLVACAVCGNPTRRFGTTAYCDRAECRKERNRRLSRDAYAKDAARKNVAQWRSDLRRKYGIEPDEYLRLLSEQRGRCRICGGDNGVTPKGRTRNFAVDHDHVTGAVRGLLCSHCNLMIGHAKDRPNVLVAAATYLQTFAP